MNVRANKLSPRERILETAADLFYRHGYHATGVNEVIAKANVAKATFYAHFPSKEDLCLAYLQARNAQEAADLLAYVNAKNTPLDRFFAVIEAMEVWAEATGTRGCQFLNMVPEVPDPDSVLRAEGHRHYSWLQALIERLTTELIESDPKRYEHLKADTVATTYLTQMTGAVALASVYNAMWPITNAKTAVHQLIED